MAGYTVRIVGLEALRRKLAPALWERAVANLLRDAATLAEREARGQAPKDTSALARGITSEAKPTTARVYTTLAYARVMEEGRKPGGRMPPPDALRGWMRRHGMANVAPFVLARAIARRGIKGRFFMRAAFQKVQRSMPALIERAGADIVRAWRA